MSALAARYRKRRLANRPITSEERRARETCHSLMLLVVRAFYKPTQVILLNALLQLGPWGEKVSREELVAAMGIGQKKIEEIVAPLRKHWLVRVSHSREEVDPEEEFTRKYKRGDKELLTVFYFVDFEIVIPVLEWMHDHVLKHLDKAVEASQILYHCRNGAACPLRRTYSIFDLINSATCPHCKDKAKGGAPVPLVPTEESANVSGGKRPVMKRRFNEQMVPISKAQKDAKELLALVRALPEPTADQYSHAQSMQDGSSGSGSSSSSSHRKSGKGLGRKSVWAQAGMLLPWDVNYDKENERRAQEVERLEAEERAEERRRAEEERREEFEEVYTKELAAQRRIHSQRLAMASQRGTRMVIVGDQAADGDGDGDGEGDVKPDDVVIAKGKPVPASDLLQEQVDGMTAEEFAAYERMVDDIECL